MQFYEYVSRIHRIPELGDIPIQRLTSQHVQAFLNDHLAQKSERTKRNVTAPDGAPHPPHPMPGVERCGQVQGGRGERCAVDRPARGRWPHRQLHEC